MLLKIKSTEKMKIADIKPIYINLLFGSVLYTLMISIRTKIIEPINNILSLPNNIVIIKTDIDATKIFK